MRQYYTRPCNFYYGNFARSLISKKQALSLTGSLNIAFDQIEVFERKKNNLVKNYHYSILDINSLNKTVKNIVKTDLKKITSKRKKIGKLKFDFPKIMGILNVTPDSFSDGGLFLKDTKAYAQAKLMIQNAVKALYNEDSIDIDTARTVYGKKAFVQFETVEKARDLATKIGML